jgi:MFS family permease
MRNSSLRRAVLAFTGFGLAEWATWLPILVYAYGRGGATEAGVVAVIQLVPAAIVAPFAATLGDRHRRERVLLGGYVSQAVAIAATTIALAIDATPLVVYALAALTTTTFTLTRPIHASILPSLSGTPAELTAANVASGTAENLGILGGPAVTGVLLVVGGPVLPFAAGLGLVSLSALAASGIRTASDGHGAPAADGQPRDTLASLVGGFTTIIKLPATRAVVGVLAVGSAIWGALDVLIVVLALDLLDMGEAGVGWLNSAVGVGGLAGAGLAIALVGRSRLARPFVLGLIVWAVPLAAIGVLPDPWIALLLIGIAGAGRGVLEVAGRTLIQRTAPDASMSRVFGVLEGIQTGMLAVGAIAVPALIALAGEREALILAGIGAPLAVVLFWRGLALADSVGFRHQRELQLLRGLPIFAPLAPDKLEALAVAMVAQPYAAGDWIIRQGEVGDRYYVINAGTVEVLADEASVAHLSAGDSFGEIALLRDVPRTASVRALTEVATFVLERDVFLEAVTGHALSREAADEVVATRLGNRRT